MLIAMYATIGQSVNYRIGLIFPTILAIELFIGYYAAVVIATLVVGGFTVFLPGVILLEKIPYRRTYRVWSRRKAVLAVLGYLAF